VGSQPCSWSRVDTDPLNFTALLVNPDLSVRQILSALVDGTLQNTTLNPPNGGWPTGKSFRLNFVRDSENLNSILAQSSEFDIVAPSGSISSAAPSNTGATAIPTPTVTTPSTSSASPSDSTTPPPGSNGAAPALGVQSGLVSLFAFLGLLLA
jgi:hypothetical protein